MSTADLSVLARAHVDRGIDHLKRCQFPEALAKFDAALRLEPKSGRVHLLRCRALARLNRFEEALEAINNALAQKPIDGIALSERGTVHVAMGHSDLALKDFDAAIRYGAKSAAHYFQRGAALFNLREWARAEADFDRVLEQEPSPPAWFYRAVCRRQLEHYEHALADLTLAVRNKPDFAEAHRENALLLASLGRHKLALQAAGKWSQLCPNDIDACLLKAEIHHSLGSDADAMNEYRRALEIDSQSFKAMNGLAWLLATSPREELQNGAEALRLAEQADNLANSADAHVLDTLAAARELCGDITGARAALDRAIAIAPKELISELKRRHESLSNK
jgi:tetratricopeptide (TPR) repeat protein